MFTDKELKRLTEKRKKPKPKWMRKLTTKDLKHLKEGLGKPTLHAFRLAREEQKKHSIDCSHCKRIAIKIGLEKPGE